MTSRELVRSVALVSKRWRDAALDGVLWRSHIGLTLPNSLNYRLANQGQTTDIWVWPRLYCRLQARNLLEDTEWKGSFVSSRAVGSRRWLSGLYHNIPGTWDLKHGGTGWKREAVEDSVKDSQNAGCQSNQASAANKMCSGMAVLKSSWGECQASQVVDLIEHLRQAGLESNEVEDFLNAQPALTFSVWFGTDQYHQGIVQLELELADRRGSLGSIYSNGHGSASSPRLSGDRVFASFRSQKIEVQAQQWHRVELVLPHIPEGARYARAVLSGRMFGCSQPQEQLGPKFTQPHLSWGSMHCLHPFQDHAALYYSAGSAPLILLPTPDSIVSILDDGHDDDPVVEDTIDLNNCTLDRKGTASVCQSGQQWYQN
ncbi:hypothetical protein WJX74_010020 [Apatococcus lobatus]|uniref:F-box domain-containing protein n=1 Tax=Apatococcus lobatus TaxID=904363 RepID=A0AAW1SGV2_9CHLO